MKREKMLIHPLNFQVLAKTPLEPFYWPIYSINFTYQLSQYLNQSTIKNLTEWSHVSYMRFKKQTQSQFEIQWKERHKGTKATSARHPIVSPLVS